MNRIYGINTIKDSIRNNGIKKLFLQNNFKNQTIIDEAKKKNIPIVFVSKEELDKMSNHGVHQGIVAEIISYKTCSLKEVVTAKNDSIIVILDELKDPHNLGAILRSADIFNVDGIVFKKNNQVSLSPLVAKISTGAINHVKCSEVTNLTRAIKELKEEGYWIIGLDGTATIEIKDSFKDRKVALVIGNEGVGISRLVRENCDLLVKIPQFGHVNCLNASCACSIALYEMRR